MKPQDSNERLFQQIADIYVEKTGAELLDEQAQLDRENVHIFTPRLDKEMKKLMHKGKGRRRLRRMVWAAAACAMLAVIIPLALRLWGGLPTPPPSSSLPSESAGPSQAHTPSPPHEIIPLAFSLPQNLSVSGVALDHAASIYYLSDAENDDVVLRMETTATAALDTEGLAPIDVDGHFVHGLSTGDYQLITFEKDSIVYTLTCKHDINTLATLCKNIL